MSKYAVKGALREVKNYTKGYSDIQAKVRQATSNDPWGPSGTMMSEIAQATYSHHAFIEIMEMIDKRLNDSGKNWRHVFKALTLLDYCLHSGSDNVVAYARENLYIVNTLREFQFIDEEGRDQGANVRQKAKDITSLLSNNERLEQERRSRNAMRDRMAGGIPDYASRHRDYPGSAGSGPPSSEEDRDLQRAIEESRRTAQEHERKMMRVGEEDLKTALELSEREERTRDQKDADAVFGGPARQVKFDPFESLDGSQIMQQQTVGSSNLMGLSFAGGMNQGGFNPYNQQPAAHQQMFGTGGHGFGASMTSLAPINQTTNPFGSGFGGAPIQNTGSTSGFESSAGYGAASHFTGDSNVSGVSGGLNIARGNAQIDPFATVAGGRSAFGGGSGAALAANPFGSTEFSAAGVMTPTDQAAAGSAAVQMQASFPAGLPGGNANNGLVNLDSLMANPSRFQQPSKNPFSLSSSTTGGGAQYDWTASHGGGPAGAGKPQPQRTLAELAAVDVGTAPPLSRPSGPMFSGGAGAPQYLGGQPSPSSGALGNAYQQVTQQQSFGGAGAFQQQPAAAGGFGGASAFGGQNSAHFGTPGGHQPGPGSNLLL